MKINPKHSFVVGFQVVTCLFFLRVFMNSAGKAYSESTETPVSSNKGTRTIHFSQDRSLGMLMIQDEGIKTTIQSFEQAKDYPKWSGPIEAQGDVVIPAGQRTGLFMNKTAVLQISELANLQPNDLYSLSIIPAANDSCMQYIVTLTGLRVLSMSGKISNAGVRHIGKLQSLERLSLSGRNSISDAGLEEIVKLPSLKVFSLRDSKITDKGLSLLAQLPSLEVLSLACPRISDKGLFHLTKLPSLRYLKIVEGLKANNITASGMAHLRTIPSLKILTLINMPIKDAGVRHLSGHKGLEALCLNRSQITDRGLASLGRMRSLKKLEISGVSAYDPFTRKGIKFLAQLASLEYLSLEYISVSLGELEYLNTLKNLKDLRLDIIRQGDSALNISGLTKLEKLDLNIHTERGKGKIYRDALQDQDVAIFSQLSSLKDLKCNMKKVSEREFRGLANLTRLERLSVVTSLNDNALACLIPLTKLQVLTINGNFSDKGLKHLEGIKSLRSLWIDTPNDFSPQAVQQLFAVLPNLQGFSTSKGRYSRAADNSIQFYERSSKSK